MLEYFEFFEFVFYCCCSFYYSNKVEKTVVGLGAERVAKGDGISSNSFGEFLGVV